MSTYLHCFNVRGPRRRSMISARIPFVRDWKFLSLRLKRRPD